MKKALKNTKIGILSLYHGSYNYGACLQAYALTKYLNNIGYDAEQIRFFNYDEELHNASKREKFIYYSNIYGFFGTCFLLIKNKINTLKVKLFMHSKTNMLINLRKILFDEFRDNNVKHSDRVYNVNNITECNQYSIYICGSDQVWSYFDEQHTKVYWLDFVNASKKKIAYSVSPTLEYIKPEKYRQVVSYLSDFTGISLRESSGIVILKHILTCDSADKKCTNLSETLCHSLDPVFLLNSFEWEKVMSERLINEDYILVYTLGNNKQVKKQAKKFSKINNLKFVYIPNVSNSLSFKWVFKSDKSWYNVGPREFLSLIKHANYVFTDSFHATALSIIFKKNFWTYERITNKYKANNNRIIDLLETFGITDKFISGKICLLKENLDLSKNFINYKNVDKIKNKKIQESKEFLQKFL